MSATNRAVEAEVLTIDVELSSRAREKFEAEVTRIARECAIEPAMVRLVLETVRKDRRRPKRAKGDFYETPAWCIEAIAPWLPLEGEPVIVDAGAGTGAIAATISKLAPRAEIIGIENQRELVERARARELHNVEFRHANFLNDEIQLLRAPSLVIMNPPFGFALQFVQRAVSLVRRGGTVCALLRMNWLASKSRREFLKKHLPDAKILTKRPSFTADGHTDATEYAWMIWGPETTGSMTLLMHDDKSKRRPRRAARKANDAAPAEG